MKILRKSTKINAVVFITIGLLIAATTVVSFTRVISDTGDNLFSSTTIRNSNGSYWDVSQSNLQDAFWELNGTGGWVSYPGGTTLNISGSPLDIPDDVDFFGGGSSSELRTADGADIDIITLNGRHNITIRHLRFNVNNFTQNAYINAISMGASQWTSNITIYQCWFVNGNASFIDAEEFTFNICVDHCFFDEIEDNIYNHAATFDGNKDTYPAGIWFSGYNCIARNNFIQDTFACGIVMEAGTGDPSSLGHLIEGNTITGRVSHGIHMEGKGSQSYFKASTTRIINNRIYDFNSSAYEQTDPGYGQAIRLVENSSAINNYIGNSPDHAIVSAGNNTIISLNIIETVQSDHAIKTTGDNYTITITENRIKGVPEGNGIHLDGTYGHSATVSRNTFTDIGENAIYCGAAIFIAEENIFTNIGDVCIEIASGTLNATISSNNFNNIDGNYAIYTIIPSIITDNSFYDIAIHCIYLTSGASWSTINDNAIVHYGHAGNGDGIHLHDGTTNCSVSDNSIRLGGAGGHSDAIEIDDGHNNTISGNRCSVYDSGIEETGASDGNIITGNIAAVSVVGGKTITDNNKAPP